MVAIYSNPIYATINPCTLLQRVKSFNIVDSRFYSREVNLIFEKCGALYYVERNNPELAIGRKGTGLGLEPTRLTVQILRDRSGRFSVGIFEMNKSTRDRHV